MGEKLRKRLLSYIPVIKTYRRDQNSMRLIKWNIRFLLFCLVTYIAMTFFEWFRLGHPNMPEFRQFIVVCGGLTSAVTILSSWLVDKDKDGRPDKATEERRPPY